MANDVESVIEVMHRLPKYRRNRLVLRVESEGTEVSDWLYRVSYPELRNFSVTGPDVLQAIRDLEAKLDRSLGREVS